MINIREQAKKTVAAIREAMVVQGTDHIPPIWFHKWLMCELFRGHTYQQHFVMHMPFYDEDMYVSLCRRCNNLQSEPVWVHSYQYSGAVLTDCEGCSRVGEIHDHWFGSYVTKSGRCSAPEPPENDILDL